MSKRRSTEPFIASFRPDRGRKAGRIGSPLAEATEDTPDPPPGFPHTVRSYVGEGVRAAALTAVGGKARRRRPSKRGRQ